MSHADFLMTSLSNHFKMLSSTVGLRFLRILLSLSWIQVGEWAIDALLFSLSWIQVGEWVIDALL